MQFSQTQVPLRHQRTTRSRRVTTPRRSQEPLLFDWRDAVQPRRPSVARGPIDLGSLSLADLRQRGRQRDVDGPAAEAVAGDGQPPRTVSLRDVVQVFGVTVAMACCLLAAVLA